MGEGQQLYQGIMAYGDSLRCITNTAAGAGTIRSNSANRSGALSQRNAPQVLDASERSSHGIAQGHDTT